MTPLTLTLVSLLAQQPMVAPAAPTTESIAERAAASAAKAAEAAERAAVAAEKAAAAAQQAAEAKAPATPPATPAADAAAAPAPAEKKETWNGLVGVGLVSLSGNAEALTFTANAAADRKFGPWALGFRANGAYGQARPTPEQDAQVIALRASATARGDRSVASFASIYALAGAETDHVKSVEARGFGEVGTGLTFYEKKIDDWERAYIRGDLAFRYSYESRFQYYATPTVPVGVLPSATLVAPRAGLVFRYALNKEIRFSEELEFLPNLAGAARFLLNSNSKLNARLTESLSIAASFLVNYDSSPAGGKRPLDTALTLGLEAAF